MIVLCTWIYWLYEILFVTGKIFGCRDLKVTVALKLMKVTTLGIIITGIQVQN